MKPLACLICKIIVYKRWHVKFGPWIISVTVQCAHVKGKIYKELNIKTVYLKQRSWQSLWISSAHWAHCKSYLKNLKKETCSGKAVVLKGSWYDFNERELASLKFLIVRI